MSVLIEYCDSAKYSYRKANTKDFRHVCSECCDSTDRLSVHPIEQYLLIKHNDSTALSYFNIVRLYDSKKENKNRPFRVKYPRLNTAIRSNNGPNTCDD